MKQWQRNDKLSRMRAHGSAKVCDRRRRIRIVLRDEYRFTPFGYGKDTKHAYVQRSVQFDDRSLDTSTFVTEIKTIKIMNGNACSPLPLLRILVWKYEHISFCLNKFAGAEPDETDSKLRDSTVYKHAINLFHCHTLIPYTSAQREFIIFAEIILWLCWCVRNTKYNI